MEDVQFLSLFLEYPKIHSPMLANVVPVPYESSNVKAGLILSLEPLLLNGCKESRKTGLACSIGPQCDCMALRVLTARNKTFQSRKSCFKAGLILSLELFLLNGCKESRKTGLACSIGPQCDCMALRVLTTCNRLLPLRNTSEQTMWIYVARDMESRPA